VPPRVSVIGAAGIRRRRGARALLLWRHPSFELVGGHRALGRGRRLDDLYPRYRVPLVLEELDLDRHGDGSTPPWSPTRTGGRARGRALLERGVRVVDLSADFRLRDRRDLRAVVREHPRRSCSSDAVYGLTELTASRSRAPTIVANPGCYPTASCSRSRRSPARG
jgi:N-acetyl-gamma-glutamyl-phosphate reductase